MVTDVEKLLQVLVNGLVLQECAFGFHACFHLLGIVLVVLLEHLHQRVIAVFQSEKGVLHLLCRDEVVTLHDFLIVLVDAHPHLVKHAVRFECRRASARDTSPLVSHNLGSMVSLQLNCVWLPSTVMRPMTGTVLSFSLPDV